MSMIWSKAFSRAVSVSSLSARGSLYRASSSKFSVDPQIRCVSLTSKCWQVKYPIVLSSSHILSQVPRTWESQVRCYAKAKVLSEETIRERVLEICKVHEKVDGSKLTLDSHFLNDLGLDSLDHIEIIMGVEDEFGFEIPDVESEKLATPADIVKYVSDKQHADD